MDNSKAGQVSNNAAEVYEEFFIPALFQRWTDVVADAAKVRAGQHVLDVACGTGILARTVAERVGATGSVVGLDVNQGMLAVAQRKAPQIEWHEGQAENLPFDNGTFDAVVSQFGLMFFNDQKVAIAEMMRVIKPGCHLAIAVRGALTDTPGYAAMVQILEDLFGADIANGLKAPYSLGDIAKLQTLLTDVPNAIITTHEGIVQFPSIKQWMYTDIKGWVLADALDDAQFDTLLKEAEDKLSNFVADDGTVVFPSPAHIITATKS